MKPFGLLLVVLFACSVVVAQQPSAATGTVTGHVTYGDTQRPARFASVTLFGVPADAAAKPNFDEKDMKNLASIVKATLGNSNFTLAQTGLDGSYSAANVPVGEYYVFASAAGYVTPMNTVQAAITAGADLSKRLPGVPVVRVVADRSVSADVAMQRGAALSGTVLWDDGSPAGGAVLSVVSKDKDDGKKFPPQFAMLAATNGTAGGVPMVDDLGHYRLASLAPGEYVVKVMLSPSAFAMKGGSMNLSAMKAASPLVFYAPATFHQGDAKTVTLLAGQDIRDIDVTLNLNATHTVSGRIASAADHHGLNAALVKLTDVKDKDFSRQAAVDAQGNYTVTFVPAGTYELSVTGAADTEPPQKATGMFSMDHTLRSYDEKTSSVIVADGNVTGQDLELVTSKKTEEDVDLNSLFAAPPPPPPPPGK